MAELSRFIIEKGVMISDGAWGTRLQNKGLGGGSSPESWNIERPELVEQVAAEYVEAGAELIKTNSFGANSFKLETAGLGARVGEINEIAAACSRKAAGAAVYVMGSIGPTGKMLITQEVDEEQLYRAFEEQALALQRGGVDLILVETMSDLEEARIAVQAAHSATGLEVACTMTFDRTVTGEYRSMMGISPAQMAACLPAAGAALIGSNCGNGIERMITIAAEIRAAAQDVPIVIHANAGMPTLIDGVTTFPETPEEMALNLPKLIESGANIIGGCCGTGPEHIRCMRAVL